MTSLPSSQSSSQSLRILLVDDHQDTRDIMSRLLAMYGHEVTNAGSCTEALEIAKKQEFDLLVSDLGLPDGTGHELMVNLQSIRPLKGIALSGYGMEGDLRRSREAGFTTHLTKPVDFSALQAAIIAAVRND